MPPWQEMKGFDDDGELVRETTMLIKEAAARQRRSACRQ
jgi:hypothetical protein